MGERAEATSIGPLWSDSVAAAVASAATYAERHQVGWVAKAWLVAPRGALGQVEWVGMVLVVYTPTTAGGAPWDARHWRRRRWQHEDALAGQGRRHRRRIIVRSHPVHGEHTAHNFRLDNRWENGGTHWDLMSCLRYRSSSGDQSSIGCAHPALPTGSGRQVSTHPPHSAHLALRSLLHSLSLSSLPYRVD